MSTQSYVNVPITTELFLELAEFLKSEGSDKDPVEVIPRAIDYWMDNASWKQSELMPELTRKDKPAYLWRYKETAISLEEDTQIRMRYKGQDFTAEIVDGMFTYQGRSMSPAQFANLLTNSSRNAWRDLWIRRPGSAKWELADDMRKRQRGLGDTHGGRMPEESRSSPQNN